MSAFEIKKFRSKASGRFAGMPCKPDIEPTYIDRIGNTDTITLNMENKHGKGF